MILVWLLVIPMIGGTLAWIVARTCAALARWLTLLAFIAGLALVVAFWIGHSGEAGAAAGAVRWMVEFDAPWIPSLGIRFHLGMDGLSLLLVALSYFLGAIAVACSWRGIGQRLGFFHFNIAWSVAGMIGVFLALDLFLFYFLWEVMLVPLYFLIGIWGHERRAYAAIKFFIFTQAGGLLMLIGILGLYFAHGAAAGFYSFDYEDLLGTELGRWTGLLFMLCFFVAFAVKLPVVLLHTWLPDAHTEAPTAGSVLLAGLVLKVGAYGMLRFVTPLFPAAAHEFAPVAMVLGVAGILYGAVMAFAQTDLKRLVAYTSVSHMGFVLLGVFAGGTLALQGAVIQIIAHGVSTGALFVIVGDLQDRIHTRQMGRMGGLWTVAPRMGGVAMFFTLASMGLPGMGNFIAEFLIIVGTYAVSVPLAAVAAGGLVASVIYALWIMQRAFQGPNVEGWKFPDLSARETVILAAMILVIVWVGLYPQPILDTAQPAIETLERLGHAAPQAATDTTTPLRAAGLRTRRVGPMALPAAPPPARWVRRPTAQIANGRSSISRRLQTSAGGAP